MSLDVSVMEVLDAFASMKVDRRIKDEAALDYINGHAYRDNDKTLHLKMRVYYFKARQTWEEDRAYVKRQGLMEYFGLVE